MRASILAVALGPVFVASAQAAPVSRNTAGIELGAAPQIELAPRDAWTEGWSPPYSDWHAESPQ